MSGTLTPSRLKDTADAANFVDLASDNFTILAEEIAKRVPTYQSGVPNTVIGPPTTGARVENEFWRDSLGAEYRCTAAGTPGTWRQLVAATVTSDPVGAPTGYLIVRSDLAFAPFVFNGSTWDPSGAEGPQGDPGSLWYDSTGAPAGGTGIVGDWALDNLTGDTYEKTGVSTWTLRGNIKGPTGANGGFLGTAFYFDDSAADLGGFNQMLRSPDTVSAEEADSVVVNSAGGRVLIDAYVTDAGIPGETLIPGGQWDADIYADVDSATGVSTIEIDVLKRASGGAETLLFTLTSPTLTTSAAGHHEWSATVGDKALAVTDRLVFRVYGKTTSVVNRTIRFYHNGSTHYSHIHTPVTNQGPQGPQGDPGVDGADGAQGPRGTIGALLVLCSAYTPAATGADLAEFVVPYDPADGTTPVTWNVRRIDVRVATAGGAPEVRIEKSTAAGAFSASTVGTVTLGSGNSEGAVTAALGTVASGNKLRINFVGLGTAQSFTVQVTLGE